MNKKRGAERASTYWAASGKFLRRLPGVLKILPLVVAAILILLAALPRSRVDLAVADADELLLRLAALGREGAAVLCNPEGIEKYLAVRIDKENPNKKEGDSSPVAVNTPSQSVFGSYWKLQASTGTVCRLQLQVAGRRFCDTDSARTQRLIGRRVQTRLAVPGGADFYDHGYELARDSTERSVIGWRGPSRACPADVEIAVAIR
ncbi:hypothetical protein [Variovorax sp. AFSI2.2]|uniref:hypothetical protein n=1 Tax=Variovorax sp. AFSI2.2 TaxID=3384160 RepID=UPI003EB7D4AA